MTLRYPSLMVPAALVSPGWQARIVSVTFCPGDWASAPETTLAAGLAGAPPAPAEPLLEDAAGASGGGAASRISA